MVGTTRSRINFFMNKFRKLGFIEYNGEIHINDSLLSIVLHEYFTNNIAFNSATAISVQSLREGGALEFQLVLPLL